MNPAGNAHVRRKSSSKVNGGYTPNEHIDDLDILKYSFPMDSEAYIQGLASLMKAATEDLAVLEDRKQKLLEAIEKTDVEITAKRKSIGSIEELWKQTPFGDKPIGETKPLINEKSFTKAISYVLRTSIENLSPTDIRDRMVEWGFDLGSYKSDVVASIHTTLRRLAAGGHVKPIADGHRRTRYEWSRETGRVSEST
jgi:hypothetical protein